MTDTRNQAPWSPDPMIPGQRDPTNLMSRQPGAVSGQFSGGDIPAAPSDWLDEQTARDRSREGGGLDGERAFDDRDRAERGGTTR